MEETRTEREMRTLRESLDQGEVAAIQEGAQIHEELLSPSPYIEGDAKEFGEHIRNGGWRLGLLVARSVDATGKGGRPKTSQICEVSSKKISCAAFSRLAGLSAGGNTTKKYLDTWDLAAVDGHVPASSNMVPGEPFAWNDEKHTPELWKSYFKAPLEGRAADFCSRFNRSVNNLTDLDVMGIDGTLFDAQFAFNPDDIYELANVGIRKLLAVQHRLELVAGQLGHTINKTAVE